MAKEKWYICSLTQSVRASSDEEALGKFEKRIKNGRYDSGQFDVEEDDQNLYDD